MKKALQDVNYELIKGHVLDPSNSPLTLEQQELLDRVISAAKILDKNPVQKHASAIHQAKYPNISRSQAYEDLRLAVKLFNTLHEFNYAFWQTWLINDIVNNIQNCRNNGSHQAFKVIAMEHANLLKAIGEKPDELEDPRRLEKQDFYILVQNNNTTFKVDINSLEKLPTATLNELNKALFSKEITEAEAEEIFKS